MAEVAIRKIAPIRMLRVEAVAAACFRLGCCEVRFGWGLEAEVPALLDEDISRSLLLEGCGMLQGYIEVTFVKARLFAAGFSAVAGKWRGTNIVVIVEQQ
ncbi:hypothetical protein [Corynebacterium pseudodiphtheriticum]|uniref:hypothetical protein n=1 Tax=Corynebacterium pseudodiphtheriticum TaxID=37637 RepID=UPI003B6345E1